MANFNDIEFWKYGIKSLTKLKKQLIKQNRDSDFIDQQLASCHKNIEILKKIKKEKHEQKTNN